MIGRKPTRVATPPITTAPRPTTAATPVMIVHNGLVSLPTAGKAPVGRRRTSTKANASVTNAATASASKNQRSGVIAPNTPPDYLVLMADVPERQSQTGAGGPASRIPPGRPAAQDMVERVRLCWLWLPLSAPLPWPVLRPLSAFCPRLASLSYSLAARVRALVTYPPARLGSELTEFSLRHLVSQAVSSRSVSETTTPAPAAACTGLLAATLRISALTSMVRLITDFTFPGLPPGQALVRCAPALACRSSSHRSRRARRGPCSPCRCCPCSPFPHLPGAGPGPGLPRRRRRLPPGAPACSAWSPGGMTRRSPAAPASAARPGPGRRAPLPARPSPAAGPPRSPPARRVPRRKCASP